MAAEGADEVQVFDLFVEVTDKAAAGQVGGCDFVERADFLLAGGWALTGFFFWSKPQKWSLLVTFSYYNCECFSRIARNSQ